jgi:hypothetical protein
VPTATSQLLSTTVPQADLILLNSGFIHRADKDSADTCMAVGCKYYESTADGIIVYTFPDTDAIILWISNSGDQYTTQEITFAHVITQMFGEDVNSWIFDHLAASASANQEGYVDGRETSIGLITFGTNITMIGIGPKATSAPTSTRAPIITPMPTFSQPVVLQEFSGTGATVTDNFQWPACWKAVLYWTAMPGSYGWTDFTLTMHNKDTGAEADVVSLYLLSGNEDGVTGASPVHLLGGEYYFSTSNIEKEWTVRVECQDNAAPVRTGGMDVQATGIFVTDNYVLHACQKSIFTWSVEPSSSGSATLSLQLCNMEECNNLIYESASDLSAPLSGETVHAVTGGTYFLVSYGAQEPWSIDWECRD